MRLALLDLLSPLLLLAAPPGYKGLPNRAVILEQEYLPASAHADRALILWVLAPLDGPLEKHSNLGEDDTEYTALDETLGHYYTAPARVSLVDTHARHVINTVSVNLRAADDFDIPFWIRSGFFYEVSGPLKHGSGKPHILALRDFNGDGKALEFAFYWMESGNGPQAMLMGYSQRQDRVIKYLFLLREKSSDKPAAPHDWMYRFTKHKPVAPMHWRYVEWYNAGGNEEWEFRYFPERERFEGTTTTLFVDTVR